jgi:hypothetical protein
MAHLYIKSDPFANVVCMQAITHTHERELMDLSCVCVCVCVCVCLQRQKSFSKESTRLTLLEGEELLMEVAHVKCSTPRQSSAGLLFLTNCHIIFAHKTRSGYVCRSLSLSLSLSHMCTRSLALIHRLTDPPRWRQQSCVDVVYQLVGYQTTDSTSKHCTYRTTNGQGGDRH